MSGRSKQSSARSDGSGSKGKGPDSNRTPRQHSNRSPRDGRTPRDGTPRSGGMTPRSDGSGGPKNMSAQHFIGDDGGSARQKSARAHRVGGKVGSEHSFSKQ